MNILCTKKLSNSQQLALSQAGQVSDFDSILSKPTLEIIRPKYSNIIFTSFKGCQYGIESLGSEASKYNYYCVGMKSKELIELMDLNLVAFDNYASKLANKLQKINSYSYITGNRRLDTIPDFLTQNNFIWEELLSYTSEPVLIAWKQNFDTYMWFSPAGIKAHLANNDLPETARHFCIGSTTCQALKDLQPQIAPDSIFALQTPSTNGLIEMVVGHSTKPVII